MFIYKLIKKHRETTGTVIGWILPTYHGDNGAMMNKRKQTLCEPLYTYFKAGNKKEGTTTF